MDTDLEKKVFKLPGGEEFAQAVLSLTVSELEARITQMQKDLNESEDHKKANELLKKAKDEVAVLSGPYSDFKKAVQLKTKFIIELIKEKGGE